LFQGGQLAFGPDDTQGVLLHIGHPGGIVSAVFQSSEAFNYDRYGRAVSGVSNYSAHGLILADCLV
jgi:hypothetical protein